MNKIKIGLWRNLPPNCPFDKETDLIYPIELIFPSGRQALNFALTQVGLSRPNRIAIPEWSSHCVISTVGMTSTPIPMNEVIRYNIKTDAVLLYEQWGWPFDAEIKSEVLKKFKNVIIILDRVDSADINNETRIRFYPETIQIELISLSKILGLVGGGLVKINGKNLTFESKSIDEKISASIWNNEFDDSTNKKLINIHKNEIEALHPKLIRWFSRNDIITALEEECLIRRKNLSLIIKSDLSSNWPEWMILGYKKGAGPGIAPIFKDLPPGALNKIQEKILNTYSIETSIYHFNWSGNPLKPNYELVLAFPIHGLIRDKLTEVIDDLVDSTNKN